ncbi:MAG: hypothetical protein R3274_03955 [Desulfobacterales bacterium]|nr:hypothetical protein [Desulfobacterales bacterium]
MQQFLAQADKIPWIMAPAIIIAVLVIVTILVGVVRLLAPASKVMLVAVMLALSAWAMLMRSF